MLQVSDHRDSKVLDGSDLAPNGEQVQEGLGRMFANAVTRVDERFRENAGTLCDSARLGVSAK